MIIDRERRELAAAKPIHDLYDLTCTAHQTILNASVEDARAAVCRGDVEAVRALRGHFALVARDGDTIRMARSLSVPLRSFIVKRAEGPALVVAHSIRDIRDWLDAHGYLDQFQPSYTRMVPAHHITQLELIGCPDPEPQHHRYFTPAQDCLPAELGEIGRRYVAAAEDVIRAYLHSLPDTAPVGVCFSGGIDSGMVLLLTYHVMRAEGMNPVRLKAFTLSIDEQGADLAQARAFLRAVDLEVLHEPVTIDAAAVSWRDALGAMEDYKLLDVEAGTMALALLQAIRRRYPEWTHLLDGDGGDENLKDYPIEDNPELTIRSVLNNLMLYHEGWGVDAIKHSATYSGGLSRGCARTFGPAAQEGFHVFSPLTVADVIEQAEGIPFIELTGWDHEKLYALKGEIVRRGVAAVTGVDMPVFEKRRFQHGTADGPTRAAVLPPNERVCREALADVFN